MRVPLTLLLLVAVAHAQYWTPKNRKAHALLERQLVDRVRPAALRAYHDLLAAEPHRAGSDGDLRVASRMAGHFRKMGLEVEMQELWLYLPSPVAGEVEIVTPQKIPLAVKEQPVDKYSGAEGTSIGWNAFSGDGEVTAGVVYANYGRKEDFDALAKSGVDVAGKIVIARYGGNFRGYKVKFAEAAGAAGVVLYTDPADSGWGRGVPYPEGGYANGTYIQRGSVLTLDYRGDPLTPGVAATKDAQRLDPARVAFPRIPVQPIGWAAAKEILARMAGPSVPDKWQGGLPFRYRVTGGDKLTVRLRVRQERKLRKTYNVTATLRGARFPDELVVAGSHHDAWGFGAGDPLAGTIIVLEAARCFAEVARAGHPPARSIVFACWAAEEYGLMGSVEWVEAHRERLAQSGVAYLNLDMAAMGPELRSAAAPALRRLMNEVVKDETGEPLKRFGDLGGGSDHVGFYCHLGIPSATLGGGGSKGVSYHSLYDNLAWYRKVVGDDYAAAARITRAVNRFLARIADADLLPIDPGSHGEAVGAVLAKLKIDAEKLANEARVQAMLGRQHYDKCLQLLRDGKLGDDKLAVVNAQLRGLERLWLHAAGLPGRPFFKNLFAAPDEDSGYAAWILPGLRAAKSRGDPALLAEMTKVYLAAMERFEGPLKAIDNAIR